MPQTDLITSTRAKDYRVQSHSNTYLGYVHDIVIDMQRGAITHAIVVVDDGALTTKRRVLVPWQKFVVAYNEQMLTLQDGEKVLPECADAPFDLLHRGLWAGAPDGAGATATFEY